MLREFFSFFSSSLVFAVWSSFQTFRCLWRWIHWLDSMWNNLPINDLVFVHDIFTRAHATRYATAEAAEPPCSFTDLLVPLRIGMSTINNNIWFLYESNQTKDVWSEVGRGGRGGGGSPHSTAHCGVRRTELRDKNPEPDPDSASKIKISVDEISESLNQIWKISTDCGTTGGIPCVRARTQGRAKMSWINTIIIKIEIIKLNKYMFDLPRP